MPRADDFPEFKLSTNTTLCTHNPLGVKGCGEAGAIGAPAAIANAIVDALSPLGVRHVEMPATPHDSGASSSSTDDGGGIMSWPAPSHPRLRSGGMSRTPSSGEG